MIQLRRCSLALLFLLFLCVHPVAAQAPPQAGATAPGATVEGVAIAVSRTTLLIRTKEGIYELFVIDSNTTKPANIPVQSNVSVLVRAREPNQAASAQTVRVLALPPEGAAKAPAPSALDEQVPQSVREMESTLKKQAARFRMGARTGVALDPELVMLGMQAQFGPFFDENMWARPNLEFGFGEVTTLVALNLDLMYRLPVTPQTGRWGMFVGAGPGFNFSKLSFTGEGDEEEEDFSFSDLEFDGGLNLIIGLQSRGGVFVELRTTAYSVPHVRFVVGINF